MRKSTHPLILRSVLTLTGRLKAAVLSSSVSVESGFELFTCDCAAVIVVIIVIVFIVVIFVIIVIFVAVRLSQQCIV